MFSIFTTQDFSSLRSKKNSWIIWRRPISWHSKLLDFGPQEFMRLCVFLTVLGIRMHQENNQVQRVLIIHYARLFFTPLEEKFVNFLKTTYFSAVQTFRFWSSVVHATGSFFPYWDFICIRKIIRYKIVLIFHHQGLLVTPLKEKLVNFLKTIYFSTVPTIRFWSAVINETRCFWPFCDFIGTMKIIR